MAHNSNYILTNVILVIIYSRCLVWLPHSPSEIKILHKNNQ